MEIRFTEQESQDIFLNALCNGLTELCYYDLELDFEEDHYEQAKAYSKGRSFEDVLLQILLDGNTLSLIDDEDTHTITIDDVHTRVALAPFNHLVDMIDGHDDATTADVILQQVFFNEIIYG
jgi:hypothetical protein